MKIITWNVNGIRARHQQLQELMTAEQPDILCLQEIKAEPGKVPDLLVTNSDHWSYWHGGGGYSGVALVLRHSFVTERPAFHHPSFDMEHRIVVADIGPALVASVYVPNGGKDYNAKLAFMRSLIDYARQLREGGTRLVICGDMNIARTDMDVHPKERKPNIIGQRPEERELVETMLAQGLVDVARKLYPQDENYFTWWAPWRNLRQRNIGWRLDYVLASEPLAERAIACPSYREVGTSDHAPVVATFESSP